MEKHTTPSGVSTIWVEGDVLFAESKKEGMMSLQDAVDSVDLVRKILKGKKMPIVCNYDNVHGQTTECRQYYASEDLLELHSACAIVTNNPIGRIIGNFYLGLNKAKVPTKLFKDKETALRWISKVNKKEE